VPFRLPVHLGRVLRALAEHGIAPSVGSVGVPPAEFEEVFYAPMAGVEIKA
jgi:hypothetical protein